MILNEMYQKLEAYPNVEVQFFNVADFNLNIALAAVNATKMANVFLMMMLKSYQKILKQLTALL